MNMLAAARLEAERLGPTEEQVHRWCSSVQLRAVELVQEKANGPSSV